MPRRTAVLFACLLVFALLPGESAHAQGPLPQKSYLPLIYTPLAAPVLKWQRGGCSSWCETGWYSSPAVINIDADPQAEIIASAYSLVALDGATGEVQWRAGTTANRTWPGIVLADLDKDGQTEIVIAQSGPWVAAYTLSGAQEWRVQPSGPGGEYRGLLAADLDNNNSTLEVVVTRAYGSTGAGTNTWVLNSAGSALGGKWPQVRDGSGNARGVYNANAAAGDLRPDLPGLELVVPSDVHYINAYDKGGSQLASAFSGKGWGLVGVWEDPAIELQGWGDCYAAGAGRDDHYRANFADGPAVIADVNGDGSREVVAVGNMYDCSAGYPPSRYYALFIFNADRSRFKSGPYDWTTIPVDTGAPLSEDYNVIQSAEPNPVVADLDGDGRQEILFASYDGRVHAFWLDKTEHGSWPYSVYKPAEGFYRFASEPVVADLDCDGKAEVLFSSWVPNGSNRTGKLHLLSFNGNLIAEVDLPPAFNDNWNGGMAAPTLANVDTDADLEVVINTAQSGVVVYDLPGTSKACNLQWPTGRGNYFRSGSK